MSIKKIEVLYDNLVKLDRLGEGSYSVVYKDQNLSRALKCYKEFNFLNEDELALLLKNISDNYELLEECDVITPKELLVVRYGSTSKVKGYSMDIVNGLDLLKMSDRKFIIEDDKFYRLTDRLVENIKKLSKNNICIMDLNEKNIMYDLDNDRFVLIDTDLWCFDYDVISPFREDRNVYMLDKTLNRFRRKYNKQGDL